MTDINIRPLQLLLTQLPNDGKWTRTRRNAWLRAWAASVNLLFEIDEEAEHD